jgi:ParB family chromosome partitioning protein
VIATVQSAEVDVPEVTVSMVPIEVLTLGDDFRLDDDPEALAELTASIAEFGLLQPLLVRPTHDGHEVVAGRRRLAACRAAGLTAVPCVIRLLTTEQALDAALVENLHRRELSPIEVALALARMRDEKGLTQAAIAERIGRSGFYVSVILRLLEMPKRIQNKVHTGKMSYSTAYDNWKRPGKTTGQRQGSTSRPHVGDEASFRAVSHWRRRHDRLVAGIHAVLKARPQEESEFRRLLDQVLKLDHQPLPDEDVR